MNVRRVAFGEDYGLNSVGERAQKSDRENREWWLCYIKPIESWFLDLIVKCLDCNNCLGNYLRHFLKLKVVMWHPFLYKNDETASYSGLQFKAYHQ